MNNYEYIIASLPIPEKAGDVDADVLIDSIREACSERDRRWIDCISDSFNPDKLDEDFYIRALNGGNAFVRDYLGWDLGVRNTRVEFLNHALGRPAGMDAIILPGHEEFEGKAMVEAVLSRADILERERGLDDIMWEKADGLTALHVLDLDVILSFIAKIKISDRWNKLDPATGRAMFRRLVNEIRQSR